jgi:hypothetical protein
MSDQSKQVSVQLVDLNEDQSKEIMSSFQAFIDTAEEWKKKAKEIEVTDPSQTGLIATAKEGRLMMKQVRIKAEKVKTELKADYLKKGRAIQSVYNTIKDVAVELETHFKYQEDFVERLEQEKKGELRVQRYTELEPYQEFVPFVSDLAELSEDDYSKILQGSKLQFEAKQKREEEDRKAAKAREEAERKAKADAEAKAEADRIAREEAAQKEAERLRIENEKLAKEKAEADAKALKEKEAREEADRKAAKAKDDADAKLQVERDQLAKEREARRIEEDKRKEIERKKQEEQEADQLRIQQEEERKAAAPDKEKLKDYIEQLRAVKPPVLTNQKVKTNFQKGCALIKQAIQVMES